MQKRIECGAFYTLYKEHLDFNNLTVPRAPSLTFVYFVLCTFYCIFS